MPPNIRTDPKAVKADNVSDNKKYPKAIAIIGVIKAISEREITVIFFNNQ